MADLPDPGGILTPAPEGPLAHTPVRWITPHPTTPAAGIFNPGAVILPTGATLCVYRREAAPHCPTLIPPLVEITSRTGQRHYSHAQLVGYAPDARLEDHRPFWWAAEETLLITHTQVWRGSIHPVISRYRDGRCERTAPWILPVPPQPVEKNWGVLADPLGVVGMLGVVYRVLPLTIAWGTLTAGRLTARRWTLLRAPQPTDPQLPLANSTHLQPWRHGTTPGYLGWWHTRNGTPAQYVHGAYWFDRARTTLRVTPILIDSADITTGHKPFCRYLASYTQPSPDTLHLWWGIADQYSAVTAVAVADLTAALTATPYVWSL